MRTRAQRRYFTEVKKRRKERLFNIFDSIRCSKCHECDWCFFSGEGSGCPYLPNPRREWGVVTRQEIRSANSEKDYKDYTTRRTSR